MVTILISLQSRKKKDNTQPVIIRVRFQNRYFDIPAGVYLTKKSFDQMMKGKHEDQNLLPNLEELKNNYLQKLRNFQLKNVEKSISINDLRNHLFKKDPNEITVLEFWSNEIEKLISENRGGSARTYKNTLSVLKKIINLDTPFSQLSVKEILTIEETLRKRGNSYNSIAVYLRTFRAICNRAIDYQLVGSEWYPFKKHKIKKEKTVPRVLSLNEMQKFFKLNLTKDDSLYKVWNIGKLLFMLRGINLRDLLFLTGENIKGDRIIYRRGKTGKIYSIKMVDQIRETFELIKNERLTLVGSIEDELYLSPNKSLEARAQVTKRINSKLKKIGSQLGFRVDLTTYVFRYSYANIAKKLGFSKDLIAEALGHEYGNSVTGIYLELFDQDVLDQMNETLIKKVADS